MTRRKEFSIVPHELEATLNSLEPAPMPPHLLEWTQKVFEIGTKEYDRSREEIAEWIIAGAREKHYSDTQI